VFCAQRTGANIKASKIAAHPAINPFPVDN
jgi:hypothetical protein